jgi:hypothetical protein
MRFIAISRHGQQHAERCAAQFPFHYNDVSAGKHGASARNRKPQTHAALFE